MTQLGDNFKMGFLPHGLQFTILTLLSIRRYVIEKAWLDNLRNTNTQCKPVQSGNLKQVECPSYTLDVAFGATTETASRVSPSPRVKQLDNMTFEIIEIY